MKNILKKAENAEKLLNLTSDTMILLDRNGVCVDIAVHDINLWFLTEDLLLRETPRWTHSPRRIHTEHHRYPAAAQ